MAWRCCVLDLGLPDIYTGKGRWGQLERWTDGRRAHSWHLLQKLWWKTAKTKCIYVYIYVIFFPQHQKDWFLNCRNVYARASWRQKPSVGNWLSWQQATNQPIKVRELSLLTFSLCLLRKLASPTKAAHKKTKRVKIFNKLSNIWF